MANTEKWGPSWLQVVLDGSTNWECSEAKRFVEVYFAPSASTDVLILAEMVPGKTSSNYPRKKLMGDNGPVAMLIHNGSPVKYAIYPSECTFDTPANVIVTFDYR